MSPQGVPESVPDDGLTTRQRRNRPLLVVHTGEMKGKSTAAFGLAQRLGVLLGGRAIRLEELSADALTRVVKAA